METRLEHRLAAFATAMVVMHHTGVVLEPLGDVGETRWADWFDLAAPYLVLGFAVAAVEAARPRRGAWLLLLAAGVLYTQGHGIHLAANSIANVDPGDTAHLWDEVVGHYLWYAGLAGVVAALALAAGDQPPPRNRTFALVLAALFGATVFTNSVEGGTPFLALGTAIFFVAWGVRRRRGAAWLLVPTYSIVIVGLCAWGAYWRGFPQFSELGWI